jgi:creatinine amidohydrolase
MKPGIVLCLLMYAFSFVSSQNLPYKLEELTALDFVGAVKASSQTCILPIGVFEKHGPHMPLGTDLISAREIACRAADKEYTVVFPWYYFSQINEARHQPGTIAYSPELIWKVLQETLDELSRNGFKKILIVNGHGGNNAFLNYFGMAQLSAKRDYALYIFQPESDPETEKKAEALTMHDQYDQHAGNSETSEMLEIAPDLVHKDRAGLQSGVDQDRMKDLDMVYAGIWWYARYPNHYSGNGSKASQAAGKLLVDHTVSQLISVIRKIKTDQVVPGLQNQFYKDAENPLNTKQ